MGDEVTIRSDTFYCALWLRHLADIPDRNWKRICRMLQRDSRNDESIRTLREWFPKAVAKAGVTLLLARADYELGYKDPAGLPKKKRVIQRNINDNLRRAVRAAERELKTLKAREEILNDYTKEI